MSEYVLNKTYDFLNRDFLKLDKVVGVLILLRISNSDHYYINFLKY